MATRSRRGQEVQYTALANPDREIKRKVADAKELAVDSIGPESGQTPRTLEALDELEQSALEAIDDGGVRGCAVDR